MMDHTVRIQTNRKPDGQRGVALVIALLAMAVISGLGFAIMISSSTESMINDSFRRSSLAYYAARGGIEEARGRMGPGALPLTNNLSSIGIPCSNPTTCPPLFNIATGTPDVNRAYYIRLNATIDPTNTSCSYLGVTGICADPNPPANSTFFLTSHFDPSQPQRAMQYVWTKITLATQLKLQRNLTTPCDPSTAACQATLNDTLMICWKNQQELAIYNPGAPFASCGNPINPVYILTALAIQPGTPRPTQRLVREVVAPGRIPGVPGPLTLNGIPGVYNAPAAFPFNLIGCDASDPAPCNAFPDAPAVIVPTAADEAVAQG